MNKRPHRPTPEASADSIVIIVKKSNHSAMAALLILVLLALGGFCWSQSGSKAQTPVAAGPEAAATPSLGSAAFPRRNNVIPTSLGTPLPEISPPARPATFFEPSPEPEVTPPPAEPVTPFGSRTAG